MRRAVHGLHAHRALLHLREVHVLPVDVPVAGLPEELDVVEDRRLDLAVAALAVLPAPQRGQLVPDDHAVRLPERRAGRQLGEQEQVQLAPELAVVARAGLLEPVQVLLELLLGVEGRPVDAGEHLAVRVTPPVGARHAEQLERLDPLGRRRVRAAAEIGEGPVRVQRHGLDPVVAHEVLDQLDLVVLPLADEPLERRARRDVLALEHLVGLHVLAHLRLERLEVVLGDVDALGELEVVVEAVVDRRADRDLRAGIEVQHRRRQHVRGVVPDQVERLRVPVRDDRHLRHAVRRQRACEIAHLAVDLHGERGAGQPLADRCREIGARGAFRQVLAGSVWELEFHRRGC